MRHLTFNRKILIIQTNPEPHSKLSIFESIQGNMNFWCAQFYSQEKIQFFLSEAGCHPVKHRGSSEQKCGNNIVQCLFRITPQPLDCIRITHTFFSKVVKYILQKRILTPNFWDRILIESRSNHKPICVHTENTDINSDSPGTKSRYIAGKIESSRKCRQQKNAMNQ